MVVSDLIRAYTDELEYLEQSLSMMSERNCTVMRVIALDQYVTIESSISLIAKIPIPPKDLVVVPQGFRLLQHMNEDLPALLCRR